MFSAKSAYLSANSSSDSDSSDGEPVEETCDGSPGDELFSSLETESRRNGRGEPS